jgi:hypothetical protein
MPGRYDFEDVRITPKPVQQPIPTYIGSFSKPQSSSRRDSATG